MQVRCMLGMLPQEKNLKFRVYEVWLCQTTEQIMALIGDTRQATSEEKSSPVETGLTGPVAMVLKFCMVEIRTIYLSQNS